MVRPAAAGAANSKPGATTAATSSPSKQSVHQGNSNSSSGGSARAADDHAPATATAAAASTIREIRSRAISAGAPGASANNARQQKLLLGARRQAASMERLNGGGGGAATAAASSCLSMSNISNLDRENAKCSPVSGSSQSINAGSAASSPSRAGSSLASSSAGLNRTASRVSRFRSAKAVFERLSSGSHQTRGPEGPGAAPTERPRGTVASRYAAAAVARSIAAQQQHQHQNSLSTSPRSRPASSSGGSSSSNAKSPVRTSGASQMAGSPARHHDPATVTMTSGRQTAALAPRPQPRVLGANPSTVPTRRTTISASQNSTTSGPGSSPARSRAAAAAAKSTSTFTSASAIGGTSHHNSNNVGNHTGRFAHTATSAASAPSKPPPRDLIDKIVLEIARDANKEHDANCTIQDLSNCDISGIPETLDFDKCFQDVEMMTEEEARKLLSRKSGESPTSSSGHSSAPTPVSSEPAQQAAAASAAASAAGGVISASMTTIGSDQDCAPKTSAFDQPDLDLADESSRGADSLLPQTLPAAASQSQPPGERNSVRFSNEPATIFDTYAPSDYDRRNDDIDPVAASAEYEIEKSREREGIRNSDSDEENDEDVDEQQQTAAHGVEAVIEKFNSASGPGARTIGVTGGADSRGATQTLRSALRPGASAAAAASAACGDSAAAGHVGHAQNHDAQAHDAQAHPQAGQGRAPPTSGSYARGGHAALHGEYADADVDDEHEADHHDDHQHMGSRRDYIESLEREVSLKRILEQNLRDLQSQYYETVKQLDGYRGAAEARQAKLEANLAELGQRLEGAQGELADARERSGRLEGQLNDMKESSQLLEKKYHRAKRIIKDMQTREESFTRREQLYQQKLDEIEHELGVLISATDRTIYEEGHKYFTLLCPEAGGSCTAPAQAHQTRVDAFALIRRMLENFKASPHQAEQSVQIKQRIVSMLEQQLANLLALSNGSASVVAPTTASVAAGAIAAPSVASDEATQAMSDITSNSNNNNNNNNNLDDAQAKRAQHRQHPYASHRLSQPNMPHPIGVGGQPTKIFHGLGGAGAGAVNEPSPPQSVNSYPSSNSLNSLTNNNNNNNNNNNSHHNNLNSLARSKLHEQAGETNAQLGSLVTVGTSVAGDEAASNFHAALDTKTMPYATNDDEWHNKPVSEWTTTQVSTWLLALGLDQYISKFEDRNVNGQSLINLDSTVLKGLGVLNSNDRNLLKKKIRELRVEMEKERKIIEKKLKENLREKSKMQVPSQPGAGQKSWKKSLLS